MGFIRGGLFVIVSVIFLFSLLAVNTSYTLYSSLDYENVKPEITLIIRDVVTNEMGLTTEINKNLGIMNYYCENNSEFVFSDDESGYVFEIPCEIISNGSDAVIEYGIEEIVDKTYYEDYDCNFWDCFQKTNSGFFLISEKSKDYWGNKFYFLLLVSIILITAMIFLIENKTNLPIVAGSLLILASLPFMKLNWIISFFPGEIISKFLEIFFQNSYNVFLIGLISGIIVLLIGIVLKFFKAGFKINEFFSKFKKEDSKASK